MTLHSFTLVQPDDFHMHLRDDDLLSTTVVAAARQFSRCLVMPNLKPPVTTTEQALQYRERILAALKANWKDGDVPNLTPLMSLYLTDTTTPSEIEKAAKSGYIFACKLYPAGATTHSSSGVHLENLTNLYPVFEAMDKHGLLLLIHGETPDPSIDIFERESFFLKNYLPIILKSSPNNTLKIVLEHVTTAVGVDIIKKSPANLCGTITAHHLLFNRNALLTGGIQPHYYCLPVLKTEYDRRALVEAVTSSTHSHKFFAGTDSAPHPKSMKESCCGSAGCYTAHAAVELYAEAFESVGKIHMLEAFLSKNGAHFYGLPENPRRVRLTKKSWKCPETLPLGTKETVVPIRGGGELTWTLETNALATGAECHPRDPNIKYPVSASKSDPLFKDIDEAGGVAPHVHSGQVFQDQQQ